MILQEKEANKASNKANPQIGILVWSFISRVDKDNRINKVDKVDEIEPQITLDLIQVNYLIDDTRPNRDYESIGRAILGHVFIILYIICFSYLYKN